MTYRPTDDCNQSLLNDLITRSQLPGYRHHLEGRLLPLLRPADLSSERFSFSSRHTCRSFRPRKGRPLAYPRFSCPSPPAPRPAETGVAPARTERNVGRWTLPPHE